MNRTREAAERITRARQAVDPLPPLDVSIRPVDVLDGYRIQNEVHNLLIPECGALAGYKIGCTSKKMQEYLSISHPCRGGIFQKGIFKNGSALRTGNYVHVGIECEIAVRLGSDLLRSEGPFTQDSVGQAVDAYFAAIEIVDDRYVEWETLGAPTLIADDFFAAGIVIGDPISSTNEIDLLKVQGRALINGAEIGRGTGSDILGHPYNALAWLANNLAQEGKSLKVGQIVMTGSIIQTVWMNKGDSVRMEFSDLGNVEVAFL